MTETTLKQTVMTILTPLYKESHCSCIRSSEAQAALKGTHRFIQVT